MNKRKMAIISILSILFIAIIVLIETDVIKGFDDAIYKLVTVKVSNTLTSIYKVITFLGSTAFIIGLCVFLLVLFIILKKNNIGYIITGSLVISTIVNNVIKIIIRRPRSLVMMVKETTYSFPSGHTMASVTLYGILIYVLSKSNINHKLKTVLSILLGILPICVAVSRIYLGAHFASDVIGGYILSVILLIVETTYINKKKWL